MAGKVKMRCAHCGKTFKSSGKETLCEDCEARERAAKAAGRSAAAKPAVATPTLVVKPRIVGAGARILDPTLPPEPEPAPEAPRERRAALPERPPQIISATLPQAVRPQSAPSAPPHERQARVSTGLKERPPKAARAPRPPRPPREPQGPVELTDEQRVLVEARYLELATPIEFDGIRTQIATEFSVSKSAVKKAISELRQRMQMPSWWELQSYRGTEADLERIRAAYTPLLPIPEVGVHKRIAVELSLDQTVVYQAIRRIRAELRLPQYNSRDSEKATLPMHTAAATEATSVESH